MLSSRRADPKVPKRKDDRVIIHFDYDCFYASVVENENPALKSIPLAIQQKQIIVTCNYEARRRGLYKLQLIKEAKKQCPDVIIVLGEDLTRFRNASKELYSFIRSFSWNDRVERLGFDEVWMDVSDIVEYNLQLLNQNDLEHSFFQLSREDLTRGFSFDARQYAGHIYPAATEALSFEQESLAERLRLGSHLAMHLRHLLEEHKGYTSTVGISTCKLLSKLVGNMNKPRGQTTLIPPYEHSVHVFLDPFDVGGLPGIGFKLAQRLRQHHLKRKAEFDESLVYGGTKENVTVGDIRGKPETSAQSLEKVLSGPGSVQGIGGRVFGWLYGIDDSPVSAAREVPRQISIEDSYIKLDTMEQVIGEMTSASRRLLERMRIDLAETDSQGKLQWIGRPETLRLSTRPRPPLNDDGSRTRSFKRISRSTALPSFCFSDEHLDALSDRLVSEALVPLFRKLHPERHGWDLSLLNVAVTNMVGVGTAKTSAGRDIFSMFNGQAEALEPFQVTADRSDEASIHLADEALIEPGKMADNRAETLGNKQPQYLADRMPSEGPSEQVQAEVSAERSVGQSPASPTRGSKRLSKKLQEKPTGEGEAEEDGWWEQNSDDEVFFCASCNVNMPHFARAAHSRFHGADEAVSLV